MRKASFLITLIAFLTAASAATRQEIYILRDELNIYALLFKESKFHGSGRHEIRGGIVVRHPFNKFSALRIDGFKSG